MFPSVFSSAAASRNLFSYRSICRKNFCSHYTSAYSLDKVYPSSSLKYTTIPKPPETKKDNFSGFIPADQLEITYTRASGAGGQNVNKVSTKVDVRFHVATAKWLTESIKYKIMEKYKKDMTKDGFLVVRSEKTRVQLLNLADCMDKLRKLIFEVVKPVERKPLIEEDRAAEAARKDAANRERLHFKRIRSMIKQDRQEPASD